MPVGVIQVDSHNHEVQYVNPEVKKLISNEKGIKGELSQYRIIDEFEGIDES
jgi:c-di-AMP phosphodiesterase-like protein